MKIDPSNNTLLYMQFLLGLLTTEVLQPQDKATPSAVMFQEYMLAISPLCINGIKAAPYCLKWDQFSPSLLSCCLMLGCIGVALSIPLGPPCIMIASYPFQVSSKDYPTLL